MTIDALQGVRHEQIKVNGIRMHIAVAGSGPLVLLLHGFPDFWRSWRHQIPALAEQFTVAAPDQRGYNQSDKPTWGYGVDVLVADVVELIAALGHERALLVGHDWGGAVAWATAIARPHRVARLAIINTPHPAVFAHHLRSNPRQMLRSAYMGLFALPWLPERLLAANDFAVLEREIRADLGDAFDEQEWAIWKDAIARPGALTGGLNWYRAAVRQGTRGLFAGTKMRCEVPTLLLMGERDRYLGPELAAGHERFVPDLRLRRVPSAGHWVQQREPALVTAELLRFFAGGETR